MQANISEVQKPEEQISRLLVMIGQPARIQILLLIGRQEACVCHLKVALGMRQASISQHLMALRKAGLVSSQREGRNIFYRLADPRVVQILEQAAQLAAIQADTLDTLAARPVEGCPCPQCNPGMDPGASCENVRVQRQPRG